jgi:WD40 repeat protein
VPPVPPTAAGPATGAAAAADVVPVAEKTTTGGDVLAIGVPRFELIDGKGFGTLVLRARRGRVIAEDARAISIWDATTGAPLRHIAPRPEPSPRGSTTLAVSADGEWLATGSAFHVRVFHAPFEQPTGELACYDAHAFSRDGKLLACSTTTLAIWDVAKRQLLAPLPASAPKDAPDDVSFAPDNRSLVWTTEHAILRWDFAGTGAVTPIYQAAGRIRHAVIAEGGSAAYVSVASKGLVVDLATGKTVSVPGQFGAALSPSGQRLALNLNNTLQVINVATGKPEWTTKVAAPVLRLAFGETDDALVYVEARRLRVAMLPGAPAAVTAAPRFAGWLGGGVAAIERGDVLRAFTLATSAWGAADRAALTPAPIAGAPTWARWATDAPGGAAVAAEPSKRHELTPDRRGVEPCDPKLRVWTATGGAKTLAMPCTKAELADHEDPGWEIGGGWAVGVAATTATIYDARTGRRAAVLNVSPRKSSHPEFAPAYWQMALAPAGDWLALVWRRAELQGAHGNEPADPRADAMHAAEASEQADCVNGDRGCQLEYFAELWNVKGAPKRVWQARLERSLPGHELAEAAMPTGVLAFDRTGARLFIGFDDGEVRVISTAAPDQPRSEHLHRAPIRALSTDPSGGWAFSADAAGEQRLWKLVP